MDRKLDVGFESASITIPPSLTFAHPRGYHDGDSTTAVRSSVPFQSDCDGRMV